MRYALLILSAFVSFSLHANCSHEDYAPIVCDASSCGQTQTGSVACEAAPLGPCMRSTSGEFVCAPSFKGQCLKSDMGDVNCGAGECKADDFGGVRCSKVEGGKCQKDLQGRVSCDGD